MQQIHFLHPSSLPILPRGAQQSIIINTIQSFLVVIIDYSSIGGSPVPRIKSNYSSLPQLSNRNKLLMLLKGILFSSKQAGRPTWSANVSTHQLTATCAAAPAIVINYPRRAFLQPPPRPRIVTDATIKLLLNNQILNKLSTPSSSPTWLAPLLYTVISAAVVQYSSPPPFYIKFPVFFI